MAIRTMRWWSASQLDSFAARLQRQAGDWSERWGLVPSVPPRVLVQAAHEQAASSPAARHWQCLFSCADAEWETWLQIEGEARDKLLVDLFDEEAMPRRQTPGSNLLAGQLIDAMWEDWWQSLGQCLDPTGQHVPVPGLPLPAAAPPAHFAMPWSGAIHAEIAMFGVRWQLMIGLTLASALLNPGKSTTPLPSGQPLAALGTVLHEREIPLKVELATLQLEIGLLQSLQPGDVIRLPHALAQALNIRTGDGTALCSAYLGQRNGIRAVELIADAG